MGNRTRSHRYDRAGLLALKPEAFFELFFDPPDRANEDASDVAIVNIRGPLDHHAGWWCDSYEEILERVDAACQSTAKAIVLRIDSPGGELSGCFETVRAIRSRAAAADKRVWSYIEGIGCSAGYALACAGERIVVSETAIVGSIGVICGRLDLTQMLERQGVRVTLVTSGERKADGHPVTVMSEAELVATQGIIDASARVFADLVAEFRGLDAEAVLALEANIFHGADSVGRGLADEVSSFESVLTAIVSEGDPSMPTKASKLDEGRAALEEAAKGEGEDAEKAKRALAAMDEEESDDDESDDTASAETADDDDDADNDGEGGEGGASAAAGAGAVSGGTLSTLADQLHALVAERTAEKRDVLFASRPDVDENMKKLLATMPLEQAEKVLAAIPKKVAPVTAAAATTVVRATRGAAPGNAGPTQASEHASQLDAAMGLRRSAAIKHEGNELVLGTMTKAQAKAYAASNAARLAGKGA